MGYAILRIAKRKTARSAAAMSAHALREVDVPNAVAGAPSPEVLAGARTTQELMAQLKEGIAMAKALGGRQGFTKASTPVLDLLVTTSNDDAARMGKSGQDAYFRQALDFIADRFGGMANILTAAVHRDETTPHMQVLVMPLDRQTNRFSAAKMIGGPVGLSELQDAFHADVGQRHGLKRGEKGSRAKHVPVKNLYKAMNDGAEVPKFVPVPPAPGMLDRLKPGYQDKKNARDRAMAKNLKARETVQTQAKTGRMMHPKMIERQADRYREAVRLEALAKTGQIKAAADLEAAKIQMQIASNDQIEVRKLAQIADKQWEKAGAQVLDKWSAHMAPEMVARASKHLRVELVAGKPLLDQLRRKGVGKTLLECANTLDRALDGVLRPHVESGDAQRDIERERPRGG